MKRIIATLLIFALLSDSTNRQETIDNLNHKIMILEAELKGQAQMIEKFVDLTVHSQTPYSYRDTMNIKATVLQKQTGDTLYHYYVIVSQEDVDYNTSLFITSNSKSVYEVKVYDFEIYMASVIEKDTNNIRFMLMD